MNRYYLILIIGTIFIVSGCDYKLKDKSTAVSDSPFNTPVQTDTVKTYKRFNLTAKPQPIAIDTAPTALIVVDMENDFGTKGGMFDRAGVDISMIQKVINPTSRVLEAARKAGIKIIYLKMGYREDLSDLGAKESPNRVRHLMFMHVGDTMTAPDGFKTRILIRNSWGKEIVNELHPHADDNVIYKTRFSGFYKTELDSILKKLNKTFLVLVGCTTSICVESTVRDAMFRDYSAIVLETAQRNPSVTVSKDPITKHLFYPYRHCWDGFPLQMNLSNL